MAQMFKKIILKLVGYMENTDMHTQFLCYLFD